jgi:hypothetical protein
LCGWCGDSGHRIGGRIRNVIASRVPNSSEETVPNSGHLNRLGEMHEWSNLMRGPKFRLRSVVVAVAMSGLGMAAVRSFVSTGPVDIAVLPSVPICGFYLMRASKGRGVMGAIGGGMAAGFICTGTWLVRSVQNGMDDHLIGMYLGLLLVIYVVVGALLGTCLGLACRAAESGITALQKASP